MNKNHIFNPEVEIMRLMEERLQTNGILIFKLWHSDASSLERSLARLKWLDAKATKQGLLNSCQYWVVAAWEVMGTFFRYFFASNAARTREFYLINRKTIASVDFLSCPDEPKCILVRLNHLTTASNPTLKRAP